MSISASSFLPSSVRPSSTTYAHACTHPDGHVPGLGTLVSLSITDTNPGPPLPALGPHSYSKGEVCPKRCLFSSRRQDSDVINRIAWQTSAHDEEANVYLASTV